MHTDDSDVAFNACVGDSGFCRIGPNLLRDDGFRRIIANSSAGHRHQIGLTRPAPGKRSDAQPTRCGRDRNPNRGPDSDQYCTGTKFSSPDKTNPIPFCFSCTQDRDNLACKGRLPEHARRKGRWNAGILYGCSHRRPWCPQPGMEYERFRLRPNRV